MNKICTDIPQSKKLIELGIDINTADMYYPYCGDSIFGDTPRVGEAMEFSGGKDISAWSLGALLYILPRYIEKDGRTTYLDIYKTHNLGWVVEYSDNKDDFVECVFNGQFLTDVCYEMIVKLKEKNLL